MGNCLRFSRRKGSVTPSPLVEDKITPRNIQEVSEITKEIGEHNSGKKFSAFHPHEPHHRVVSPPKSK